MSIGSPRVTSSSCRGRRGAGVGRVPSGLAPKTISSQEGMRLRGSGFSGPVSGSAGSGFSGPVSGSAGSGSSPGSVGSLSWVSWSASATMAVSLAVSGYGRWRPTRAWRRRRSRPRRAPAGGACACAGSGGVPPGRRPGRSPPPRGAGCRSGPSARRRWCARPP